MWAQELNPKHRLKKQANQKVLVNLPVDQNCRRHRVYSIGLEDRYQIRALIESVETIRGLFEWVEVLITTISTRGKSPGEK